METVPPFNEVVDEIRQAGGDAFRHCFQCGLCDSVCPWNRVRQFSIRKIIREATFGLTQIEEDEIWLCTTCGSCPQHCPRGVRQIEVGVSLRRVASDYEVFPSSVRSARTARASLISQGNPLQIERENRKDWARGLGVKEFDEKMEILFFVGCYLSFDPRMKKVARAIVEIFNQAGVDFGILGNGENCCGESIRKTGSEKVFKKLARENIKNFIDRGVRKIVVSSPHCFHTFKNEYPEFMVNFEVVHISQYLAELVAKGRIKIINPCEDIITYHDPCYLGRHNGIYGAPRTLLGNLEGAKLVEMKDTGAQSLCCGGGGGRIWMDTPKEERFSDLRIEQAKATGAKVLVTACPYCITNFEESRLNLEAEGIIKIRDITEMIRDAVIPRVAETNNP